MTREDYGYMLEAINDMEWDAISEAAEEYTKYEFIPGDVQEVDTSDITATVWSVNGIRDGDEPPVLDETVKGKDGKDLNLHIDMTHGYPEIVGSIDGREVAREDGSEVIDVANLLVDDADLDVEYETLYRETPVYDSSIGGWLPEAEPAGVKAVVSGSVYLDADGVKINAQKFMEMNRGALEKAGFSEIAAEEKTKDRKGGRQER